MYGDDAEGWDDYEQCQKFFSKLLKFSGSFIIIVIIIIFIKPASDHITVLQTESFFFSQVLDPVRQWPYHGLTDRGFFIFFHSESD